MAIPQHIIPILEKRLAQQPVSAEELAVLRDWYEQEAGSSGYSDAELERYLAFTRNREKNDQALRRFQASAGFGEQAVPEPSGRPAHRVHFLRRWGWAAAIFILLGAGAYLYTRNTTNEKASFAERGKKTDDILPGTNKALLTLSDGTTITLDSAANGAIAQEGNSSIIKDANGHIRYDLKGPVDEKVMMNTMTTPRGGQYELTLPDGTKVWLNAASSISFPAVFVGNDRKVKVTGEAYLEVAKDKAKPFIVDIDGKSTVQVLGTSFNINAHADEAEIKTTLIEGSVRVLPLYKSAVDASADRQSHSSGTDGIILKPGQQAIQADDAARTIVHSNTDLDQVLAWKNGIFNFEGRSFASFMKDIERWYDIQVEYKGDMPELEFGGKMNRAVPLSDIMRYLNNLGLHVVLKGRTLIIAGK